MTHHHSSAGHSLPEALEHGSFQGYPSSMGKVSTCVVDLGEKSVKARETKISDRVLCQGPQQALCSANTASFHQQVRGPGMPLAVQT